MTLDFTRHEPYTHAERKLDILFGVHSNFPPCCIAFFVSLHEVTPYPGAFAIAELNQENLNLEYIPCPACHEAIRSGLRGANVVHYCDEMSSDLCKLFKLHNYDELLEALSLSLTPS